MKIIDIHTHLLYGIDDGAADREMSLALIGRDYEQGVRGIFCTNHSYGMETEHQNYYRRFEELCELVSARYPDLALYRGCEILSCREDMPEIIKCIRDGIFPTMNGSNYVLMEFDPYGTAGVEEMRYSLEYALDQGYYPIIAHAERYRRIYKEPLQDLASLKELGCKVQINLFSVEQDVGQVRGSSRKELANLFLEQGLVDFVGTDSHRLDYKSPEAAVGAEAIRQKYGDEYAELVLCRNAEMLLIGEEK